MRKLTVGIARRLIGVQFLVNIGGTLTQTCVDKVSPSGKYVLLGGGLDPNSKSWGWVETEKVEIVEFVEEDGVDKCSPPDWRRIPPAPPVKKYLFIGGPYDGEWHIVRDLCELKRFIEPDFPGGYCHYRRCGIATSNERATVYKWDDEPTDVLSWLLAKVPQSDTSL